MSKIVIVDFLNNKHSYLKYVRRDDLYFSTDATSYDTENLVDKYFKFLINKISRVLCAEPVKFIIATDSKPYVRKSIYPEYKDNRNNIVKTNYDIFYETTLFDAINFAHKIKVNNHEADDIIYTLSLSLDKPIILSNDSDLEQIDKCYFIRKGELIYNEFVYKKFASKILKGDISDNIPKIVSRFSRKMIKDNLNHNYEDKYEVCSSLYKGLVEYYRTSQATVKDIIHLGDIERNYDLVKLIKINNLEH